MKYSVLIGRFQPVHSGHVQLIERALNYSDHLIIAIGSSNVGRSPRNPFTFEERVDLIRSEFNHGRTYAENELLKRISFVNLSDMLYDDEKWVDQVRYRIRNRIWELGTDPDDESLDISLTGYDKDPTSYYLRFFPEWKSFFADFGEPFNSTAIREFFYSRAIEGKSLPISPDTLYGNEIGITQYSGLFKKPEYQIILSELAPEWDFNRNYDPKNYHVNVMTVDSVVICNGHILLVKRKHKPGKGKLALPGGHIDKNETLLSAALRELREETSIDLSNKVLRQHIVNQRIFDHPQRSERARVITNAYLIHLKNESKLPKIKGADDAESAFWVPFGELRKEQMFEDHYDVACKMWSQI